MFKKDELNISEDDEIVDNEQTPTKPDHKYEFIIQLNDSSKKVKLVQFVINAKTDGVFGPKTQEALDVYRKEHWPDEFDGHANKISSVEYDRFISTITDMNHIDIARSYVGKVKERDIDNDGIGDNRSSVIDKMTKYVFEWFNIDDKDAKGYPWCAIFISYVLKTAYSQWTYKSAAVREWINMMEDDGNCVEVFDIYDVRPDKIYIGCWLNSNGYGHIFFVDPYKTVLLDDNTVIATIEGNTNDGGSRDGTGVFERQRYFTRTNKIRIFEISYE